MPDMISRIEGNDHLSLGPARYMSFKGHSIDAELLVNGEPAVPMRHYNLGVSTNNVSEYPGEVVVGLTVPFDGKAKTFRHLSHIPGSRVDFDITGKLLAFSVPQPSAGSAFNKVVPLLLPETLRQSAGAIVNFANVMAYYLPK